MKIKFYYLLLLSAILLDAAVLPWMIGAGWMFKAVMVVLPFILLFAPERHLVPLAAVVLIYLRAAGSVNLGILFLGLAAFLVYERWFLANFFHKTAWQSLILASGGIAVFYAVIFLLDNFLGGEGLILNVSITASIMFSMAFSAGLNFLLSKTARLE